MAEEVRETGEVRTGGVAVRVSNAVACGARAHAGGGCV